VDGVCLNLPIRSQQTIRQLDDRSLHGFKSTTLGNPNRRNKSREMPRLSITNTPNSNRVAGVKLMGSIRLKIDRLGD
jgi:hypothetical protein